MTRLLTLGVRIAGLITRRPWVWFYYLENGKRRIYFGPVEGSDIRPDYLPPLRRGESDAEVRRRLDRYGKWW